MSKTIKVSKNVTFTLDNLLVIEQLMSRTRKNFSQTLNILIQNWVTVSKEIKKQQDEITEMEQKKELEIRQEANKRLDDLRKAEVKK